MRPEIPKDVEVGLKSLLLDRTLQLNLAFFHEAITDFQTQSQEPSTQTILVENAGELLSRGVELELTSRPLADLTLTGGVTYNDTKYEDLSGIPCYFGEPTGAAGTNVCLPSGSTNSSGDQLAQASRWAATLTSRYEHPVWAGWRGFLQGDGYFRSSYNFANTNDPRTRVGSAPVFGLSLGAQTNDQSLSINLFVRNLFDRRIPSYIVQSPGASADGDGTLPGTGDYMQQFSAYAFRTIGLSFGYHR